MKKQTKVSSHSGQIKARRKYRRQQKSDLKEIARGTRHSDGFRPRGGR